VGYPLPIKVIDALIVVSILVGAAAVGAVFLTAGQAATTVSVGSMQVQGSYANQAQIPVTLTNKGPLTLSGIGIQVDARDSSNDSLITGSAGPLTLASGQKGVLTPTMTLATSGLSPSALYQLATTNENLTFHVVLTGGVPPFVKVTGSVSTQLEWGAPVDGLAFGTISEQPHNATAVEFSVPVSFSDSSSFLTVDGNVTGSVATPSGTTVGSVSPLSLSVGMGQRYSGTITGYVSTSAASQSSLVLNLSIQTAWGTLAKQVTVNA
jgi:hypothetical protein